jgi:hypothetical protein
MKTLLVIFLLFSFKVIGGEVKGFKGGMDLDEVLSKVKSKNWKMIEFGEGGSTYVIHDNNQSQLLVAFCNTNQKINWLSHSIDSKNLGTYVKLLLDHQQGGWKITDMIPKNTIGYDGLEYYIMTTVMEGGGYIKELIVHGREDHGITSIQIVNNFKDIYC